jgi:hypothetical protein
MAGRLTNTRFFAKGTWHLPHQSHLENAKKG